MGAVHFLDTVQCVLKRESSWEKLIIEKHMTQSRGNSPPHPKRGSWDTPVPEQGDGRLLGTVSVKTSLQEVCRKEDTQPECGPDCREVCFVWGFLWSIQTGHGIGYSE